MTTPNKQVLSELTAMLASRAEAKVASVKRASVGDDKSDGTSPTRTGSQAAANADASKGICAARVDNAAADNKDGDSIANSQSDQNVSAAATDGNSGAKGNTLAAPKVEGIETGAPAMSAASAKIASDLLEEAGRIEKLESAKIASVTGIRRFLVDAVRADSSVKIAADMDDAEVADQAGDQLSQAVQGGQVSEEDAAAILEEALKSGAITEEDIAQAAQELQGQGGASAGAGADAGVPPEAAAAAAPSAPAGPEEMVSDPSLEAKMAAADIGPDHPMYLSKLENLYGDAMRAGAEHCVKVAHSLGFRKVAEDTPFAGRETPGEERKEERHVVDAVKKELGLSDERAESLMRQNLPEAKTAADRLKIELLTKIAFEKKA